MTGDESILNKVDEVLAGGELLDQPRALLLLRMCQFTLLYAPNKTERYWQLLQPSQRKLPSEHQEEVTALSSTMEEALPSDKKKGCSHAKHNKLNKWNNEVAEVKSKPTAKNIGIK